MKDQTIRLKLVGFEAQLALIKEHIINREPELARRVLKQADTDAAILAANYANEEPLKRLSYLIHAVADSEDIEIVNMINDLLTRRLVDRL